MKYKIINKLITILYLISEYVYNLLHADPFLERSQCPIGTIFYLGNDDMSESHFCSVVKTDKICYLKFS